VISEVVLVVGKRKCCKFTVYSRRRIGRKLCKLYYRIVDILLQFEGMLRLQTIDGVGQV
jgi:hypothetical protein